MTANGSAPSREVHVGATATDGATPRHSARPFVAVIGAGMSGLYMAKRLKDLAIPFAVYEKGDEIGGTWRLNRYPGLFVDVPASLYQLPFAPKYDWLHPYPAGPEIQEYLLEVTENYELREHIQFGTEVVGARWTGSLWELSTSDGQILEADAVVAATGFLHKARIPSIPGMDSFEGRWFHSSQWPEDLEVEGSRVGVVGSGSSGVQLVPALSAMNVQVTQFVRTPQWIETIDNPLADSAWLDAVRSDPSRGPEELAALEARINQDPRLRDPRWKLANAGEALEAASQALREDLEEIEDPELRAILTPDFPPGCKRIPKSADYFKSVQRPNVRVVPHGVARVEPRGAVTADGQLHELDVLVYATGFDAHAFVRPMQVFGVDGVALNDVWAGGPFAYRGLTVPGFPNLFLLQGPFSPVNNIPVPKALTEQIGYVIRLLEIIENKRVSVSPTDRATAEFRKWVGTEAAQTVWAYGCDNWYKDANGEAIIWPWFIEELEQMFTDLATDDLEFGSSDASRPEHSGTGG